ncbi:MAG TPA: suppressor of fused domain protein [Thermoanaerobaculia bacterium]
MSSEEEENAPGWDAIDDALEPFYHAQEPVHWAPEIPRLLGGPDPLDGISAYASDAGGIPHWHYVTYGFTELFDKETEDEDVSGFGFELTFRLKREDDAPPQWPVDLLQSLARYVFDSGNPFGAGHGIGVGGSIAHDRESELTAVTFVRDPELAPLHTLHGRVEFLQVVGLTAEEFDARKRWSTDHLLDLMRPANPMFVSDLDRPSLLADPANRAAVEAGIARDGSSLREVMANVSWREENGRYHIELDVRDAEELVRAIDSRLAHQREFGLLGEQQGVGFLPAEEAAVTVDEALLLISVDETLMAELRALPLVAGRYTAKALPVEFSVAESG